MAASDFEATWYPRIGKDAAEALRRYRRSVWFVVLAVVFSMGAGVLIGRSSLGDAIGGVCVVCALISVGLWFGAQFRTAAAVSVWFGVKRMWALPRMTPQRFDEWRTANGFRTPDERTAAERLTHQPSTGMAQESLRCRKTDPTG